jgi:hypothetical protein
MDESKKNTIVMIVFFALIMWMAIYYSTVLQKKLQSPLSYIETGQETEAGQFASLN